MTTKPLHQDPDARRWAREFNSALNSKDGFLCDEGWLVSWFANAMMASWDEHQRRFKSKSLWQRLRYAWHNWNW